VGIRYEDPSSNSGDARACEAPHEGPDGLGVNYDIRIDGNDDLSIGRPHRTGDALAFAHVHWVTHHGDSSLAPFRSQASPGVAVVRGAIVNDNDG